MTHPVIQAIHVSKTYPQLGGVLRRQVGVIRAVDGVDCALQPGETLGLVGESGCGKTTLAKLLVGLLRPTEGEVRIHGESFAGLRGDAWRAARRAVQFVFQDPMTSLNPRMRISAILAEPLIIHGLVRGGAERQGRVEELLDLVQLPRGYGGRFPRELSGGERQRIGIARALATNPEALICDEPIASLDVSIGAQILELLRRLTQARQMALLFISHDLRAVASLCRDVAVMRQGRILERSSTEELLAHPRDAYTELLIRSAELDLDAV